MATPSSERAFASDSAEKDACRLFVESVVDYALFLLDPNGSVTSWNLGAERIYGYEAGEIIGRHFSLFYPRDDLAVDRPARDMAIAIQAGRYEEERPRVRKDGTTFWAVVTMTALYDSGGKHVGFAKIVRDVSERKLAEEQLRDQQSLTDNILESLPGVFYLYDEQGRFLRWNRQFERVTGYTADELRQLHPLDLFEGPDKHLLAERIAGVFSDGSGEVEAQLVSKSGQRTAFYFNGVRAVINGQTCLLGMGINVDNRLAIEAALDESRQRLALAMEAGRMGSWMWDVRTNQTYWNAQEFELLGLPFHDGPCDVDLFFQHVHPDDIDNLRQVLSSVIDGGTEFDMEFRVVRTTGETRWLVGRGKLFRDPSTGQPLVMTGINWDITERKELEQAVEANEKRYRALVENSWDGVMLLGEDRLVKYVSPAVTRMLGYAAAEVVGRHSGLLMDVKDIEDSTRRFESMMASPGANVRTQRRMRHKDGRWRWIESVATNLVHEPYVGAIVVNFRDITESRQSEDILRQQAELSALNAALGQALVGTDDLPTLLQDCARALVHYTHARMATIWTFNMAGNLLELRARWDTRGAAFATETRPLLGKCEIATIAQLRQTSAINNLSADDRVQDKGRLQQYGVTAFTGFPMLVDERLVGVMGVYFEQPPEERVVAALTAAAQAIALGMERKRSQVLLASVMDNVIDAIIGIDERGVIQSFNSSACKLFGYTEEEVLGKNVKILMPEPYQSRHDSFIGRYVDSGQPHALGVNRHLEARHKDGHTFPVDVTLSEFQLSGKRHFTGVVRDTSKQRLLERQFQQSQKMEAMGQLAAGIAHDFNNLLTVISGYSEMLLAALPAEDPSREAIKCIFEAGDRAVALTRQLLAFSRQSVLEPKILNVNAVVRETEKLLTRVLGENIELLMALDPAIDLVRVDPGQLGQVLMNLAVNARDAMPLGGTIRIETNCVTLDDSFCQSRRNARPGRFVQLSFRDSGSGMTSEVKARIFEPFFTTKTEGKGTGLGLAVVLGIVEQSGGFVDVASEPGEGCSFHIYFPIVERYANAADLQSAGLKAPGGTETLLLVEDEISVRGIAALTLKQYGYQVITASDGHQALKLAQAHPGSIDVLVTDVVMPGMSGRELAEQLRVLFPKLKVLFMSGYTDDEVIRHGLVHEQVEFLQKPFLPAALARKVRQVIDSPGQDAYDAGS